MIFGKPQLGRAVDAFQKAVEARDSKRSQSAFRNLQRAFGPADATRCAAVGPRLAALLEQISPGPRAQLAVMTGACVERGADPAACAGPILACAREALADAVRFVARWESVGGGELPEPGEPLSGQALDRLGGGPEAQQLAFGWSDLPLWEMAAVAVLSHAAVRRNVGGREELLELAGQLEEHIGLKCLTYALRVLDDEPLVVLHRPSGAGFRLRMGGIGDNFQLHTLLAAVLIGGGHLPGEAPSAEAVTACLGGSRDVPRPDTVGAFNLVAPSGEWIWNEGTPSDIPIIDGVRLLVLDPPPYRRGWAAGGFFPSMRAELSLERALTAEESAACLARIEEPVRYGR